MADTQATNGSQGPLMGTPLPLASAALRLRGRPGRPRKAESSPADSASEGTRRAHGTADTRANGGLEASTKDSQSGRPTPLTERRLLDVPQTAAYLGDLGEDTVRELDAAGVLTPARVEIPGANGRKLRKVLFDRLALDRLTDGWRTPR